MRFQPACLLLVLLLACLGCQEPPPPPTPTPTIIIIPTQFPTAIPDPTVQPAGTSAGIAVLPAESPTPAIVYRTSNIETFDGLVVPIIDEANALFAQGKYSQAITKYKEAQRVVNEPSRAIQGQIGLSYRFIRDNEQAIHHFSKAIDVHDTSADRVNRASVYLYNGQCQEAMQDAQVALAMEPSTGTGFHTDVEAHLPLAHCFTQNEQYELALAHVDSALTIANEYKFSYERIEQIAALKVEIEAVAEGDAYPEDLLVGYASEDFAVGLLYFYQVRSSEAIAAFQSAQRYHGKPSSSILHMLARSYVQAGDSESGLRYFSEAIEVRDDALNRYWRSHRYSIIGDCEKAVEDSNAALNRQPHIEPGFHTSVEAFLIIAGCQSLNGQFELEVTDFEEALKLAEESGYQPELISLISEFQQEALELKKDQETPTP